MEVKADKELQLKQDPQMVWKVMTDPALMVVSVPGAELTETLDERNFKGKIGIFEIETCLVSLRHSILCLQFPWA